MAHRPTCVRKPPGGRILVGRAGAQAGRQSRSDFRSQLRACRGERSVYDPLHSQSGASESQSPGQTAIISLLVGAVPPPRIVAIVKERGIKFAPTMDDLNEIRAAGGNDELLQALQQAAPPK